MADRLSPLLAAAGGPVAAVAAVRGAERAVLFRGPVGEDSRFETGSLTKTFTALLLAELAARGEVRYGDRADRYLPFRLPGPPLTLLHLATHTSGLPRLPPGLLSRAVRSGWLSNPYAGFSEDDLLASLRRTRLRHRPGTRVLYSNFGGALLGHVLARAAGGTGGDYPALLADRITAPLGLSHTDCDADTPQITGYWHGRPRPALRMPGLVAAGRGALQRPRSAAPRRRPARPGLRTGSRPAHRADGGPAAPAGRAEDRGAALPRLEPPSAPGRRAAAPLRGTRGFTAFTGFLPVSGTGLVALTNTAPTPLAPFVQAAYGTLHALDARPPEGCGPLGCET